MKALIAFATLTASALVSSAAFAETSVGSTVIEVPSPQRNRMLSVRVWYPSDAASPQNLVGENRIFNGEPAAIDAPIKSGQFPLILLSHGSGSRAEGLTWIATRLAEEGYIVAGPNHPGTTSGDSTPIATPRLWERTQDISNIISTMTADAKWQASMKTDRIGVLGFSLGGSTALELIGARASLNAYADYCDRYTMMMDCQWFKGGFGFVNGKRVDSPVVDLHTFDKAHFEQSNLEPRIKAAVIVDPGLATAFQTDSLKEIKAKTTIINLGSPGSVPVAVYSYKLSGEIPGADYHQISGANHFSFLPVCKPGALEMLSESGDADPICDTQGLRDRAEIHREAEKLVLTAFDAALK